MLKGSLLVVTIMLSGLTVWAEDYTNALAIKWVDFDGKSYTPLKGDLWQMRYFLSADQWALELGYVRRNNPTLYQEFEMALGYPIKFKDGAVTPAVYLVAGEPLGRWLTPSVTFSYGTRWIEALLRPRYFVGLTDKTPDRWLIGPVRLAFRPTKFIAIGLDGQFAKVEEKDWRVQAGPVVVLTTSIGKLSLHRFSDGDETELIWSKRW